jgi:hypothetical protein
VEISCLSAFSIVTRIARSLSSTVHSRDPLAYAGYACFMGLVHHTDAECEYSARDQLAEYSSGCLGKVSSPDAEEGWVSRSGNAACPEISERSDQPEIESSRNRFLNAYVGARTYGIVSRAALAGDDVLSIS